MKIFRSALGITATALLIAAPLFAQNEGQGRGQAVVTVLPEHGAETAPNLNQQDLKLKINGRESTVTNWIPLRGKNDRLEMVVLIDGSARTGMSTQLSEIAEFIKGLPPNSKAAVAYMDQGAARFAGPLTTDHNAALKGLHIPIGIPGSNASPYFCLSDLAKRWPSNDRGARREVVMITDGVDNYDPRYDPEDPYMQTSIKDSVRAGLVVYSIYWTDKGRYARTMAGNASGQNLLLQVTEATGGNSYWEGIGNPVSFHPYFQDLDRRLQNQYELGFTAPLKNKPEVDDLKLKVDGVGAKVDAPKEVFVTHSM